MNPGTTEADRLARLSELVVLDSAPEPLFDSLARMASEVCGTPIALLSLIDAERQWFKANVGLSGVNETPRDVAFCAHAIADDALFEVPDATRDPRFAANPLVSGAPDIRFYAGAPLVLQSGARVGTLCVIDRHARRLDEAQARTLMQLAAIASQALEMRRDLIIRSLSVRSEYEEALSLSEARHRAIVEDQSELVSLARPDGELVYVNPAYARHFGKRPAQMVGASLFDFIEPADRPAVRQLIAEVLGSGEVASGENRMVAADGRERWVSWTNARQFDAHQQPLLHSVGRDVTERKQAAQAMRASQAFLARTGRVAGVGGWELELATGAITWSEETRRIHEVGPDFVPTLEAGIAFYAPEARATIEAAVQASMQGGEPWDLELPFITATGRPIWVRAVGETEFENGKPLRLTGAFQDITERRELQRALRELTTIFDNTTDYVVQTDWRGTITYMNAAVRRAAGLAPDEPVVDRNYSDFNPPSTQQRFAEEIVPAVKASGVWVGETTVYDADRREVPVSHMVIAHRDRSGRVERYSSVMRDISAAVEAKRQQQRQATTLRSVIEAIPAIVAVVGADGRYRFVNSGFERWRGATRDTIIGRTLAEVLGPTDFERTRPWVEKVLMGETIRFERDYPGRDGTSHLALTYIPLWLDNGAIDGFVGVAQDITPHRQEELRLLHLTQRDPLTGLLNRAGFEQYMERRLQEGGGPSLALLCIDLDHFKPVNDQHGHAVGDQVLQLFAQRLQGLVRPTDGVARLGGDEFAVVLPGLREGADVRSVADKVIAAAHAPFDLDGLRVTIGASVGVAYGATPNLGWRELLARADASLYDAKDSGRGRQAGATRL